MLSLLVQIVVAYVLRIVRTRPQVLAPLVQQDVLHNVQVSAQIVVKATHRNHVHLVVQVALILVTPRVKTVVKTNVVRAVLVNVQRVVQMIVNTDVLWHVQMIVQVNVLEVALVHALVRVILHVLIPVILLVMILVLDHVE